MAKEKSSRKTHRALELVDTLGRLGGSARTSQLAETMDVSEETVRRTVKRLSKEGLVNRVHGGVFLTGETQGAGLHRRLGERSREKKRMAKAVAGLIKDGASVFLDVGSTSAFVAEALRKKSGLLVVTNSLTTAQSLMGHNDNRVFIAGGELNNRTGGAFGASALDFVSGFSLDMAVLSADSFNPEAGYLLVDQQEAEMARVLVAQSRRRIMVADHSKAQPNGIMLACDPQDIDIFVTDTAPEPAFNQSLNDWKTELVIAQRETP